MTGSSEEIARAGSRMYEASQEMQRAAMNMEGALERHQRFLDDWLQRLEFILTSTAEKKP